VVWEAARATCASSAFFKPIDIGVDPQRETFIGGDTGHNNPTLQLLQEAILAHPESHVACIISIGAGQTLPVQLTTVRQSKSYLSNTASRAINAIVTNCEQTAQEVAKRFQHRKNLYFRFNVVQGLQNIKFKHWERLSEVVTHSTQYLHLQDVNDQMTIVGDALYDRPIFVKTAEIGMFVNIAWLSQLLLTFCAKMEHS
jgi:hypothetical protein